MSKKTRTTTKKPERTASRSAARRAVLQPSAVRVFLVLDRAQHMEGMTSRMLVERGPIQLIDATVTLHPSVQRTIDTLLDTAIAKFGRAFDHGADS